MACLQFPEFRVLLPRDRESLVEGALRSGFGTPLHMRFADAPVQLGDIPTLAAALC